ncbi:MAG: ABC transporter permease subunit [Bacteroidetes bacterium]|nr:ABC transporter permease subunit [Bacteroidota bacterium]
MDQFGKSESTLGLSSDSAQWMSLIGDSLDVVLAFPDDMAQKLDSMEQATITLYYRATEDDIRSRVDGILAGAQQLWLGQRLEALQVDPRQMEPVVVRRIDLSSSREKIGQTLGAMVPYFFMIFCFLGCMYPAIDLGAGEKERGTMETLLSSPASRLEIFMGKFGVVALGGLTSAMLAIGSLALSIQFNSQSFGELPPEFTESMSSMVQPGTLAMLFLLLLPLTVFFASTLMTLSISAQSFKEAQSLISPVMILVMLPTVVAFIPGIELTTANAWIPIFNVSLAARDILAGTLTTEPFLIAVVSLFALALLGMLISLRYYKSERNVLPS